MQSTSELQLDKLAAGQRRPRTGRGSQGGRWWRSIDHHNPKRGEDETKVAESIGTAALEERGDLGRVQARPETADGGLSAMADKCELQPLHVLVSVHQSGVNCLCVSSANQHNEESAFCVLSGGDDQALSCLFIGLASEISVAERSVPGAHEGDSEPQWMNSCSGPLVNGYTLKVLRSCKVDSAHSAAVKGD